MKVVQLNLQPHFGGGEVFTAFLCRALSALGVPSLLIVHPDAQYWCTLSLPNDTRIVSATDSRSAASLLPKDCNWLIGHGPLPPEVITVARMRGALATALAHMPVQGRRPEVFANHTMVFAVSEWVLSGLRQAGIPAWNTPLYGVADLARCESEAGIVRHSCYDWDRRKVRDRLLSRIEPLLELLRAHPPYQRRAGLTLGLVSRLTPIKQFPLLFENLVSTLSRFPSVNLEIFGSGGYASVRDLRHALLPIADRVRFWGHQSNVVAAYRGIDYLMTGLPEKEALGLNVIEAQASGTPVIAPNAAPFTETIVDGITGFLYRDPRLDGGEDFQRLLERITQSARPDPRLGADFLERFSYAAFVDRLRPVVAWVQENVGK